MRPKMFKTGFGSGGLSFFLFIAVVVYAITSVAIAMVNIKDCGGNPRHWSLIPPKWVCEAGPYSYTN